MRATAERHISRHVVEESTEGAKTFENQPRATVDAYQAIVNSNLPDLERRPDHLAQEVLTLLLGGSATSMRVMSRVIYHVASSPDILGNLKSEVDAVVSRPGEDPKLEVLEQQRYLVSARACIFLELTT